MSRALLLLILFLTLTGCWTGPVLFTAADAAKSLKDGAYRLVEAGSSETGGDILPISTQHDGSLLVTGPEHPWRVLAVPLAQAGRDRFILQLQQTDPKTPERAMKATYMLLDMRRQHPAITILACDAETAAAVEASDGFIARDPQSASSCGFTDGAVLKQRIVAAGQDLSNPDIELVRVGE
ncbi:hypothetical protein C1T17_18080 [Sphingobium sp. SCG-1]|uniref:hypothetical protein n=1 Tax=Sphingobium sp. SCG-1 TaxID=2072936 RepID=UPI000CD6C244|nr:hypothetical protein [Sphingobium sp. SCG-1]AUW59707.1 hypothetical protein C1T17_18080 [Sphingobium sp. SCG-1]